MATKFLSKTFNYGLLIQTNWATPQAAGAAFKTIPYNAGATVFDPDVNVGSFNTSGQSGIHKEIERVHVDGRSGLPRVNFSMPADVKTLAPHLAGALFTVVEGGGSPFTKTITSGGLTGTIDFNGDDTKLHTIAMDNKASADDGIILENSIIGDLNISWDFLANGTARLMQIEGNWVGNEMNFEQTTDGTWSTTTFTPMGDADVFVMGTFTVDGVNFAAQNVRRFTFNVANNVTTNSATTAGKPNQFDIAPVYTSTVILDYNPTTEKVLKDFQDGATVVMTIVNDLTAADGFFSLTGNGGILQKQPFTYNGEFAGIELDILWYSTSAATPISISFIDTIDWGY